MSHIVMKFTNGDRAALGDTGLALSGSQLAEVIRSKFL
jgi:hypothetical protein